MRRSEVTPGSYIPVVELTYSNPLADLPPDPNTISI